MMAQHPGLRIAMMMPTLEQAKKVHAQQMVDELNGEWACLDASVNRSDWRVTTRNGSWIQWVSAENARNARGLRCDIVTLDEADDIDIETFDAIIKPWLSEPRSLKIVSLYGTPTRGRHGLLYKRFRMGLDGVAGHHSVHATYLDVPEFVDVASVERDKPFVDAAMFAREWLADFDSAEGLVYPMFSERFHVRPALGQFHSYLVGADFGFEDPGVFLVAGVQGHGKDARVHLVEEHVHKHKPPSFWTELARATNRKYGALVGGQNVYWYPDPSRADMAEAFKREGCRIGKTDNGIEEGIAAVTDFLVIRRLENVPEYAKLYVAPECKEMIKEFGLYRRKRDPRNRNVVLDTPEDKFNHLNDSLRYLVTSHFGRPTVARDARHLPVA